MKWESDGWKDALRFQRRPRAVHLPPKPEVPQGGKPSVPGTSGTLAVALAGNPNVGKSTVFNGLTGLKQHTGNWPGKTVHIAEGGRCRHRERTFTLVDIPGTYSLISGSSDEEIARDYICFGQPAATIIVTDATCLERNLILVCRLWR